MEMDKELADVLLKAMIDMKDALDNQSKEMKKEFAEVNQKLDNMADDIADIKSDIAIINGMLDKHERRIKKLERATIQ